MQVLKVLFLYFPLLSALSGLCPRGGLGFLIGASVSGQREDCVVGFWATFAFDFKVSLFSDFIF